MVRVLLVSCVLVCSVFVQGKSFAQAPSNGLPLFPHTSLQLSPQLNAFPQTRQPQMEYKNIVPQKVIIITGAAFGVASIVSFVVALSQAGKGDLVPIGAVVASMAFGGAAAIMMIGGGIHLAVKKKHNRAVDRARGVRAAFGLNGFRLSF